jgi:cytochrome c-type biogenesis protein CcmH
MFKRSAQVVILLTASLSMLGAGTPSTRFDKLGHKLMCTCGCAEILLECNHVGCPNSTGLIKDLHAQLDAGLTDEGILTWFAEQNGPTVLAAPFRNNFFDNSTWYVPGGLLLLGIAGIFLLVRYWKSRMKPEPALPHTASNDALIDRIRKDTEY